MNFILYEDRPADYFGVQVLLRSVARFHPDWSATLFLPDAPDELCAWCQAEPLRSVEVIRDIPKRGWNAKPRCLLSVLERGAAQVLWLDCDVALTRNTDALFGAIPAGTLIAAEEAPWINDQGSRLRTKAWGFEIGRDFPRSINSCALRVGASHIKLLERWDVLLHSADYQAAQQQPWDQRARHLAGDQDVLNALLGSTEFSSVPVRLLKNGAEIAQCYEEDGYRVLARVRHAFRPLPPILHAQGSKPWRTRYTGWKRSQLELSPYSWIAARLAGDVPGVAEWARPRSALAKVLNAAALGDPSLRGLLPAAARTSVRLAGRSVRAVWKKCSRSKPQPETALSSAR